MRPRSFGSRLAGAGLVLALALAPAARADERADLLEAFQKLNKQSVARLGKGQVVLDGGKNVWEADKGFQDKIDPVKTPAGESKLIVKVAFWLPEKKVFVAPDRYRWGREEPFEIRIHAAVPVKLGLFDVDPKSKTWERVFPTDKSDDRMANPFGGGEFWDQLPLGRVGTNKTGGDEVFGLTAVAAGTPSAPRRVNDKGKVFLGESLNVLDASTQKMLKERAAGTSKTVLSRSPANGPETSAKLDDVAVLATTTENQLILELPLQKKK